jgi:hypothetical protein
VFSTALTLAAMGLSLTPVRFPFDGAAGILISLFILRSGWEIAGEIISQLLGKPAERELSDSIRSQILSHPEILGVHDLIIHDYGPGVQIGSAHAEVDSEMTLVHAHEIIDEAEEEILEKYHVNMTLHTDPVDLHNQAMDLYKTAFSEVLHHLDEKLSLHDFRLRVKDECEEAAFDVLIPYECTLSQEEIEKRINEVSETLGKSGRILLRESGTEPLIRVMVESQSQKNCEALTDKVISVIKKLGLAE